MRKPRLYAPFGPRACVFCQARVAWFQIYGTIEGDKDKIKRAVPVCNEHQIIRPQGLRRRWHLIGLASRPRGRFFYAFLRRYERLKVYQRPLPFMAKLSERGKQNGKHKRTL